MGEYIHLDIREQCIWVALNLCHAEVLVQLPETLQVRAVKQADPCPTKTCAFWDSFLLLQSPCAAVIVPPRKIVPP